MALRLVTLSRYSCLKVLEIQGIDTKLRSSTSKRHESRRLRVFSQRYLHAAENNRRWNSGRFCTFQLKLTSEVASGCRRRMELPMKKVSRRGNCSLASTLYSM